MVAVFSVAAVSCAASDNYAPVVDVSGYEAVPASGFYRVAPGDTLYSIAWRYGADYSVLAKNNNINAPYAIHTGQIIYLRKKIVRTDTPVVVPDKAVIKPAAWRQVTTKESLPHPVIEPVVQPVMQPVTRSQLRAESKEPKFNVTAWQWPSHGKILSVYSAKNKGIDIGDRVGTPVYASAPGKIVYAGNGLRGYGNLIIIKHNSQYLSAYAYNRRLLVREGDWVKSGQVIGEMGKGSSGRAMLHFEIRRAGMPVNPLNLLTS